MTGVRRRARAAGSRRVDRAAVRLRRLGRQVRRRGAQPPIRGVTLAMNEPIGVIGIVVPGRAAAARLRSRCVAPAIAMGNRWSSVPSRDASAGRHRLLPGARDLRRAGRRRSTSSPATRDALAKTLAEHDDVDAIWYFGDARGRDGGRAASRRQPEADLGHVARARLARSRRRRGPRVPARGDAGQEYLGAVRRVAAPRACWRLVLVIELPRLSSQPLSLAVVRCMTIRLTLRSPAFLPRRCSPRCKRCARRFPHTPTQHRRRVRRRPVGELPAPLDSALVVRVLDGTGKPVTGVSLRWNVTGGGRCIRRRVDDRQRRQGDGHMDARADGRQAGRDRDERADPGVSATFVANNGATITGTVAPAGGLPFRAGFSRARPRTRQFDCAADTATPHMRRRTGSSSGSRAARSGVAAAARRRSLDVDGASRRLAYSRRAVGVLPPRSR